MQRSNFYSRDDAAAIDYLDWAAVSGPVRDDLAWLEGQRNAINKFLSHVTLTRIDPIFRNRVERDRPAAASRLERVWKLFWGQLDPERRSWFR